MHVTTTEMFECICVFVCWSDDNVGRNSLEDRKGRGDHGTKTSSRIPEPRMNDGGVEG